MSAPRAPDAALGLRLMVMDPCPPRLFMPSTRSRFRILVLAALPALAGSCSREAEKDAHAAAARLPARVSLVKLMSWAEPAEAPCDTDLQGHAAPARYSLRYTEDGHDPVVIETDNDKLVKAGWAPINRSDRGMGFEKSGDFTSLDFDIGKSCNALATRTSPTRKRDTRKGSRSTSRSSGRREARRS